MKRILTFSVTLMFALTTYSQQISVKSFRSLPTDLDARVHYPKEDKNGEKAAIIKIVTNETGFEFDAGTIGIVASEQKTGEIWLYIPRGSKEVTIKHPKFTLLRNYTYPQSIESGEVYEMTLVTGRVVTTIEEPIIETQWLLISTDPIGADVYINDQPAGKTPYQNEFPVGKYTWRVSKELYIPEAGLVELSTTGNKQLINVKMKPDFGTLQINTDPEINGEVSFEGMPTGKLTPCSIEKVPSGEHRITITKDMYETTIEKVMLTAGEIKQVTVKMNPTFSIVTVNSEPAADIYINGQFKSNHTWQGRLNPGVYTFEARLDKYLTATEKQTVTVGEPLNVNLNPTPKTGNLKIITLPFEATIKINGEEKGKTPLTLKNQLIGDYTFEISLEGYTTAFEKTTISEGQTSEINITMQKASQIVIGKEEQKQPEITPDFTLSIPDNYTETNSNLDIEMVLVKGGTFQMGSKNGRADEKPLHSVRLSDYYIGKYEVTQKQWVTVMGYNPSLFKGFDNPVENVSWFDAQNFIKKLNQKTGKKYRLPTEAEWEYAARKGNKSQLYDYAFSGSDEARSVAWTILDPDKKTHPVGLKKPNELGIYDMNGNVWEWCSDWYGLIYYNHSPFYNPKGPTDGSFRVNRGGGWNSSTQECTNVKRGSTSPFGRFGYLGFRLVRDP